MGIDQHLFNLLVKFLYARYAKAVRPQLYKWQAMAEESRLVNQMQRLGSRGHDITLRPGVHILAADKVHLGNYVAIGYNSILRGHGGITLEDYVLLGDNVLLATAGHPIGEVYFNNIWEKPILIKQNTWLAADVVVLPGVTIGENCAIGAGAVVTHDIPPNSVAVGAPATVVRQIEPDFELMEQQKQQIRAERVNHPMFPPFVYID